MAQDGKPMLLSKFLGFYKNMRYSFKKVISDLDPSIFLIQETKYKDASKLKLENPVRCHNDKVHLVRTGRVF